MARINFPNGFSGSQDLPHTRTVIKNMFLNEKGIPIQRPGINEIIELDAFARGHFVWNGARYVVFNQELLKITDQETGATELIGTIAGAEIIETVATDNQTVIIVISEDGDTYTLDKSDTLLNISGNTNFSPNRSIAAIDKRVIYCPFDRGPVYFSNVGAEGTVEDDSFFDAEQLPDGNEKVFVLRNSLMIAGSDSTEIYTNIGTLPVPFQRRDGGAIDNGIIGGLIKYGITYLFIGRETDQDFGIYAYGNGVATRVSNEAVDEILASYSLETLAKATANRFRWLGNDIATFIIGADSLAYREGTWYLFESSSNGEGDVFGAGFIVEFEGKYYTAFKDKLGVFKDINTDYGEEITKEIIFGLEEENGLKFPLSFIEIGASQGFNPIKKINGVPVNPGSIALRLSHNNKTFGPPVFKEVGREGDYNKRIQWRRLGSFEGFVGINIYARSNIKFNLNFINIDAQGKLIAAA